MFGETESESPRMPSPWEAIASSAPSPSPSPLALCSSAVSSNGSKSPSPTSLSPVLGGAAASPTMKYLDAGAPTLAPSESSSTTELKLAPEVEEGNVEYKLKLIAPTPARFTRLVTQLKYRLLEGGGQALYEIGVSDFGELVGLSRHDLDASLDTLERMAGELGATVVVLKEIELPEGAVGAKQFVLPKPQKMVKIKGSGQQKMSDAARSKKAKDREARRQRRAAALLVGEFEMKENLVKDDDDSDDDSMSRTVTLSQPSLGGNGSAPTPPMPIIKPYPYGRKPFGVARVKHIQSSSLERGLIPGSSSLSSVAASSASSISQLAQDDFVYTPSASSLSPPSAAIDAPVSVDNDEGEDDDVDPVFGFNLDISSMSLSDQPRFPPLKGPAAHYTPATSDTPLITNQNGHHKHKHHRHKKPIIPAGPTLTPAEKAAERRQKRDAKREEKKRGVNAAPPPEPEPIPDPTPEPVVVRPPTPTPPPVHVDEGPKLIAEALVVRKLALEEAFLDFGGFALADEMGSDGLGGTFTTSSDGGGGGIGVSDSDLA